MRRDSCDALVVGGGPAGSTCARALRSAGFDVMLMDGQPFPRDKVCAGWITPAVVASLGLDLEDYARGRVLQPIRGFRIGAIGGRTTVVRYAEPASYGILRREFDHYLLQRAQVRIAPAEPVTSMLRDRGAWLVNGRIRTPLLIGAGGHFCPVARLLGATPGPGGALVVAQEAEFRVDEDVRRACGIEPDVAQLYFCPDLKGYGWCFAKGAYLNVGLGREDSHRLPEHVERFRAWLRKSGSLPTPGKARFKGHAYLLYPSSRRVPCAEGAVLVGDSAGLAYPESGEGIRPAIESALIAAAVAREASGDYSRERLAPYAERLQLRFGARGMSSGAGGWLPRLLRQPIAARLLASPWFARRVVIDRWFLHAGQSAMLPTMLD